MRVSKFVNTFVQVNETLLKQIASADKDYLFVTKFEDLKHVNFKPRGNCSFNLDIATPTESPTPDHPPSGTGQSSSTATSSIIQAFLYEFQVIIGIVFCTLRYIQCNSVAYAGKY